MTAGLSAYWPHGDGPTALFLDTGGLFAYFHPGATQHDEARAFMQAVGRGEIPYRPLFTSTYVVDELVTLLQAKGRNEWAVDAFEMLTTSENVTVLRESRDQFEAVGERLSDFADHEISFTDHLTALQMDAENVEYVFTYDGDFQTLGWTSVPHQSS